MSGTNHNVDDTRTTKAVEWFFGYGGNHIGLKRAIPDLQLIAVCEIEAFALCGILEKMEQGRIDPSPIWSDCKTFPSEPFKNRVDLFIASYPCQPFSSAGGRKGADDPRHLWPYVIDWVRMVRPTYCFFENVEGHISLGLSTVLSDLESAGYKTAWGIFSAAEVGAPHQRKRVFILAESQESVLSRSRSKLFKQHKYMRHMADTNGQLWSEPAERRIDDAEARPASEDVAYSIGSGLCGGRGCKERGDDKFRIQSNERERDELRRETEGFRDFSRKVMANTDVERLQRHGGHEQKHGSEGRKEQSRHSWPSRPGEPQHEWEPPRTINGTLNPDWVETLMGLEVGWTGTGSRIDRLRLLGNGVVPQVAELAWNTLAKECGL